MERHDVLVGALLTTQHLPQLHSGLGRHSYKVVGEVLDLLGGQGSEEHLGGVHLVHHGDVLDGAEVRGLLDLAKGQDVLDRDLTVVVLGEVAEGDARLEADEAGREDEERLKSLTGVGDQTSGLERGGREG